MKEQEESRQNKELQIMLDAIKDLEEQKRQLELIKNSLSHPDPDSVNMKEYPHHVKNRVTEYEQMIDSLVEKNKEVLKLEYGVENRDQLVQHEDFSEDEEVLQYKKSLDDSKGVDAADSALRDRLQSLDVALNSDEFSYDNVEKSIIKKIQTLDKEIVQQKLQTPEGRVQAIESIAGALEQAIPTVNLSGDIKKKEYELSLRAYKSSYGTTELVVKNDTVAFPQWWKVLDGADTKILTSVKAEYGDDIAQEAIKQSYKKKIDTTFKKFDDTHGQHHLLKKELELISPKEAEKTQELMTGFNDLLNTFFQTIEEKSKELKAENITLDTEKPNTRYYNRESYSYEEILSLFRHSSDKDTLHKALKNSDIFPPQYDFIKLQQYIEDGKTSLSHIIDAVKKIQTKEDIETVFGETESPFCQFHINHYNTNLYSFDYKLSHGITDDAFKWLREKTPSHHSAEKIIDEEIASFDTMKDKATDCIALSVDAVFKRDELKQELKKENFANGNIDYIDFSITSIENTKEAAKDLKRELLSLEMKLPQEELTYGRGVVTINSIVKDLENKKADQEANKKKLTEIEKEISNLSNKKPSLFGVKKWEQDQAALFAQKKEFEDAAYRLASDINGLQKKRSIRLETHGNSVVADMLTQSKEVTGLPDVIFIELKTQIDQVIVNKPPESVVKLYKEYNELKKKVSSTSSEK